MNLAELQRTSEEFHRDQIPGFMTNTDGFILEANQAAAKLFGTDIPNMKNKRLCVFIADRKNSPERFNAMRVSMQVQDTTHMKNIVMRTQPSKGKKEMLTTNITGHVVGRGGRIVLTRWTIEPVISTEQAINASV